jgi:hypothetical protein
VANLSRHGGPSNGWLLDSMFQEIDIATDELLFEWRASEHFPIHESHQPMLGRGGSKKSAFDFFTLTQLIRPAKGIS